MVSISKKTAPAGTIATMLFPLDSGKLVIISGSEIDSILEQIDIKGQLQAVTAILMSQSDALLRGPESIPEGELVALLIEPDQVSGNGQGKLTL